MIVKWANSIFLDLTYRYLFYITYYIYIFIQQVSLKC